MSKIRLQISDSGAFSEPENGLELLPTNFGTAQRSRYNVVKIAGRKGGVSQHMGADRKQFSIGGIFLGDAESISTKRLALENLLWNTDSAERGKSISMSTIYREGKELIVSLSDGGQETWSNVTDSTYWFESSSADAYVSQSEDEYEGDYCAFMWAENSGSEARMCQFIPVVGQHDYTFSAMVQHDGGIYTSLRAFVKWYYSYPSDIWSYEGLVGENSLWVDNSTATWHYIGETYSAPATARHAQFIFYVACSGFGAPISASLQVDNITASGDDTIIGYTESQNINIKGYNISQRRGARGIYDVSVDMEEEY